MSTKNVQKHFDLMKINVSM